MTLSEPPVTPRCGEAVKHALVLGTLAAALAGAARADDLRNWFDDPFLALSQALPDCPRPAGPFVSERERQGQAHRRAEKGTTCWLAGECERPNAFAYDRDIAAALQALVRAQPQAFAGTTLWATVQGRVVYLEGCAADARAPQRIEALVRALPHVQQALAIVRTDPRAAPPYRLAPPKGEPALSPADGRARVGTR
jgi:hypothetical protein